MAHLSTVIITGGCSGLGHAAATYFVKSGLHVSICDLNAELGAQRVSELGAENCDFYAVDVTQEASVQSALTAAQAAGREVRGLVNCAGIAPAKRLLDRDGAAMPLQDFSKVIDINLIGTFNVCRLVASAMATNPPVGEAQERGMIINTASVAAYEGQIGQTAYAASKAAIVGLCLPMARDLAPLGIRVNTIAPGVMGTPMLLAMPEKVQDALCANVQFPKRLGLPEEFAKLALHIAQNHYLNAETIRLDGGLRMPPK